MQGDNLTDRVVALGLATPANEHQDLEINPAFGGPIMQDKPWFWFSAALQGAQNPPAGAFINRNAWNPNAWLLDHDLSQPADNNGRLAQPPDPRDLAGEPAHKIAFTWQDTELLPLPDGISATTSPEAATDRRFPSCSSSTASGPRR